MQARLLLSQDICSFEKKPTICGLGYDDNEVKTPTEGFDVGSVIFRDSASGLGAELINVEECACVSGSGGV